MYAKASIAFTVLAAANLVAGHGAIISATGNAGGQGMALGIDSSTPRDGTRREPFQQDSTRFRGPEAATVGETLGGGANNIEAGTRAIMAETGAELPQVTAGGSVDMQLHQVNGDGGGPYTCEINGDATAQSWEALTVSTTPPGENSRNRQGQQTAFPLVAEIPADQTCTGSVAGQDNVCMVRCMNAARAGPFGGVIPVQMVAPGAAANGTAGAAARRNLARAIKESELLLAKMTKRAATIAADEEEDEEEE